MNIFFKPAVRLMNRLSMRKKIGLIGIIAVFVIGMLLVQLLNASLVDIHQLRDEIESVQFLKPISTLYVNIQTYRQLSFAYVSGDKSAKTLLDSKANDIRNNLDAISQQIPKLHFDVSAIDQWQSLRTKLLQALLAEPSDQAIEEFNNNIINVRGLIDVACNQHGLLEDAYYDTSFLFEN